MIEQHLMKLINTSYRSYDGRGEQDKNIIHASDLKSFCTREFALCIKSKVDYQREKFIYIGMRHTFEIGNAIETIVTKRLHTTKHLLGTWRCFHCSHKFFGFYDNKGCPECKSKAVGYCNTTLELTVGKFKIRGNKDVLIVYEKNTVYVVEVKSMKPEDWAELEKPLVDHRRQLSLYLWMLKSKAKILFSNNTKFKYMTDKGVILYVSKGIQKNPHKPFIVHRDEPFINEVEAKMEELKTFSKNSRLPKRICASQFKTMAKKCRARELCFKTRR